MSSRRRLTAAFGGALLALCLAGRAEAERLDLGPDAPVEVEAAADSASGAMAPADDSSEAEPVESTSGEETVSDGESPRSAGPGPSSSVPTQLRRVQRAWFGTAPSLRTRVDRTRAALDKMGVRNLDAAARALFLDETAGSRLERASGAVRLAPDLPAARMAHARALWTESGDRTGAIGAALGAAASLPGHLEAALWFEATLALALVHGFVWGALLFLAVLAATLALHAAHDLGDAAASELPFFARVALLAALVTLPVALGEGLLGFAFGLFALVLCYGRARERVAAGVAALLLTLVLHPAIDRAGRAIAVAGDDPVAESTFYVERGLPTMVDLKRLEYAAARDPLAAQALALHSKRAGLLADAEVRFAALIEDGSAAPELLNNAGNVQLARGNVEAAIRLYERASDGIDSAEVLFNLSQAYGQAIRLEEQDLSLAEAQERDPDVVSELTQRFAAAGQRGVVDLPAPVSQLRRRIVSSADGERAADALRRSYAPGMAGSNLPATLLAFGLFGGAAWFGSGRFRRSHWCVRCGARLCPRCHKSLGSDDLCVGCTRLFRKPETIDPEVRTRRLTELRLRQERVERVAFAASVAGPGIGGVLAKRPFLGLVGALLATLAISCFAWSGGAFPDPISVGGAGRVAFVVAGGVLALGYLGALGLAVLARGSMR